MYISIYLQNSTNTYHCPPSAGLCTIVPTNEFILNMHTWEIKCLLLVKLAKKRFRIIRLSQQMEIFCTFKNIKIQADAFMQSNVNSHETHLGLHMPG